MSRSYAVLAASLIGVAGLAGVAHVSGADGGGDSLGDTAGAGAVGPNDEPDWVAVDVAVDPVVSDDVSLASASPPFDRECTLSTRLQLGVDDPEVRCLEAKLIAAGVLVDIEPDDVFDDTTEEAVERFQERRGLAVDGVVGPQTAMALGSWTGPDELPPDPDTCPDVGRAAVVDRDRQRTWLCDDGEIAAVMAMSSAVTQPDPGSYTVYAKDPVSSSDFGGAPSTMRHFVAFTHGEYQGARIAFHSVPTLADGSYVQPLDSLGSPEWFGDSAGCIRLHPDDASTMWDWLAVGDTVDVVT